MVAWWRAGVLACRRAMLSWVTLTGTPPRGSLFSTLLYSLFHPPLLSFPPSVTLFSTLFYSLLLARYLGLEQSTGCTGVGCLVGVSQERILEASKGLGDFFPTVDGVSLPATPIDLILRGEYNSKV